MSIERRLQEVNKMKVRRIENRLQEMRMMTGTIQDMLDEMSAFRQEVRQFREETTQQFDDVIGRLGQINDRIAGEILYIDSMKDLN